MTCAAVGGGADTWAVIVVSCAIGLVVGVVRAVVWWRTH